MRYPLRRVPDSVLYKDGYSYTLSYLAENPVSASKLTSENISLTGTETGDKPRIKNVVYDVKTNRVNLILAKSYGYDIAYTVSTETETYECETEEVLPAIPGTVSIKSVSVSKDGLNAEITVYNATYSEVTKDIVGTNENGEEIFKDSITISAESTYKFTATGTDFNNLSWTLTE